jgi:hypothetical protein
MRSPTTQGRGPVGFTAAELAKVGVELVNSYSGCIRCMECGSWGCVDQPPEGKRRRKGYWKCENRCNG